jgi:hypothetical protein
MLNKTRHKLVNWSNKELIKIDGFNKMNMVSELDDSIGNHLIAKQLSFRLQTILNERMDGYVHRADCYYSKKDQHFPELYLPTMASILRLILRCIK